MMDSREFSDLTTKLANSTDISQIREVCILFKSALGLDRFLFAVCNPSTSLNEPSLMIISDYPEEWLKEYNSNNFVNEDPVVQYCQVHSAPVMWKDLMQMQKFNSANFKALMDRAKGFGLKTGLSIPLRAASGEFGVFSMAVCDEGQEADNKCGQALALAQLFATYVLEAVLALSGTTAKDKPTIQKGLTRRERDCLFWACEGKTAWEISKILNVSERTVLFHLTNVTTKLGASNRQHAVAKAILQGFVKPNIKSID